MGIQTFISSFDKTKVRYRSRVTPRCTVQIHFLMKHCIERF